MLLHHVARMEDDRFSLREWVEYRALWDRIVAQVPGFRALAIMPNHVHGLHHQDVRLELAIAVSGFAHWRHALYGTSGAVWERLPPPEPVTDGEKTARNIRYLHLNPCRGRLVNDPLAAPFTTHRDATGLTLDPIRKKVRDIAKFHRYVSNDATVRIGGTNLPVAPTRAATLREVEAAVSSLLRQPVAVLRQRGSARDLLIHAARALTLATRAEIATWLEVSERTVQRAPSALRGAVLAVAAVVGDPRFAALDGAPPRWR